MGKIIAFGEDVEGFNITVLNEREIRAAAGMVFLMMFSSFLMVLMKGNYTYLKIGVFIFLIDFVIRVFINPKYSPTLILGRMIVSNQTPEYVGAAQKKFAWKIGIAMAVAMFVLLVVLNSRSQINRILCYICLTFLFFESVFGICLGCKIYPYFTKEKVQYCPGEVCELKNRHEIQKTSWHQILIVLGFAGFILLSTLLFKESFGRTPVDLFGPGLNNHRTVHLLKDNH